jgi:pimeloyl-ACP methyl ester carboxylesterase
VDDYVVLLDALGIRQVGVTGLSGGGPYVLGLAHRLPSRVVAVSLLGGVAPSHGPEGIAGGLVAVAVACRDLLPVLREPLGWLLSTAIQASRPVSDVVALPAIRALLAEADARELEDDDLRAVFVGDILRASRRWLSGPFYDATLFATDWGFSLADVAAPVHIWQGDADDIVPLAHGVHQSRLLPRSTLTVQPGFGHLGGLGLGREVLEAILSHWPTERSGTVHAG